MLKNILRYLHALKTSPPPLLGRWCNNDKSKNNWKVDMANTDHCGSCSYDAVKEKYKAKTVITRNINSTNNTKPQV